MQVRSVWGAVPVAVASAMLVAGCGDHAADPADSTSSTVQVQRSDLEKVAAVQACRQVITSAGVMVRDYNAFMKKLNSTQSYDAIGDEDRWAVETLTTGADLVRKAMTPAAPDDLVAKIEDFSDSSDKLAERIKDKKRTSLNTASKAWSADRTAVLDMCAEFLPTE